MDIFKHEYGRLTSGEPIEKAARSEKDLLTHRVTVEVFHALGILTSHFDGQQTGKIGQVIYGFPTEQLASATFQFRPRCIRIVVFCNTRPAAQDLLKGPITDRLSKRKSRTFQPQKFGTV